MCYVEFRPKCYVCRDFPHLKGEIKLRVIMIYVFYLPTLYWNLGINIETHSFSMKRLKLMRKLDTSLTMQLINYFNIISPVVTVN